jgi:hypothetical protein
MLIVKVITHIANICVVIFCLVKISSIINIIENNIDIELKTIFVMRKDFACIGSSIARIILSGLHQSKLILLFTKGCCDINHKKPITKPTIPDMINTQ